MRMGSGRMTALAVVLTVLWCQSGAVIGSRWLFEDVSKSHPEHKTVVYYLHESLAGSNITVVPIAGQNNNLAFQGLGFTNAFHSPINIGPDVDSAVIGFAAGIGTATSHPNITHVLSTHTLNSPDVGVGTLDFTGNLNYNPPLVSEVAVTGGTGDFGFVRGVAKLELFYFGTPYNTYRFTGTLVKD